MPASVKKTSLKLPRAGTKMRQVADALVANRIRVWLIPGASSLARCAQILRDTYHWPIEDQLVDHEKYHKYRLDPERRAHYEFV